MSLPITALTPDYSRRRKNRRYAAQATGVYVALGDAIDFSTILNPGFLGDVNLGTVPTFDELSCVLPGGYDAQFVPGTGTTLATAWKLQVFASGGAELAAGAYPAVLLATPILIVVTQRAWAN
jgi:hypothetical protein